MATVIICDYCDDRIEGAIYYIVADKDACRSCYKRLRRPLPAAPPTPPQEAHR